MSESSPSPDDSLIGRTVAGRYRVISKLGEGGMGVTYRAWDEAEGRPVVLKMPRRNLVENAAFLERFSREVRMMAALSHPSIVPILDVGEDEGLPILVMRFLPGGSLSNRRLRDAEGRVQPMQPSTLQLWLPAVASALDFVHANGIVHRDVKPANIFFDAFWGAYLGDFGIAKIVEDTTVLEKEHTLTATSMMIGTQEYMAPEQFAPKAVVDGRVDQYALAVMVYEMLVGQRPFRGETAHVVVEVTTQPVPRLTQFRRDLPDSVCQALYRGLSKKPGERFGSCAEFAAAVLRDVRPMADEEGVARLLCPQCGNMLKMPTSAAGRQGKCPRCKTEMMVAEDLSALWLASEEHKGEEPAAAGVGEPESGVDSVDVFTSIPNTPPVPRPIARGIWSQLGNVGGAGGGNGDTATGGAAGDGGSGGRGGADPTVRRVGIGAAMLASLVVTALLAGDYAATNARKQLESATAKQKKLVAENESLEKNVADLNDANIKLKQAVENLTMEKRQLSEKLAAMSKRNWLFRNPSDLSDFQVAGVAEIPPESGVRLGNGVAPSSISTKLDFTPPIRVEYDVSAGPGRVCDIFPGIFVTPIRSRKGIQYLFGDNGGSKSFVLIFGEYIPVPHEAIKTDQVYRIAFEVDANRQLTITRDDKEVYRNSLPAGAELMGPIQCGGGIGNVTYKRLSISDKLKAGRKESGLEENIPGAIVDDVFGMKFIYVPSGSFPMGSPQSEEGRFAGENQAGVTFSAPFLISQTEVTQAQWRQVMGSEPWKDKPFVKEGMNYPASHISWEMARDFCNKLTEKERLSGRVRNERYALPTEAQWEYACRAGTRTAYSFGSDKTLLGDYAWWGGHECDGNSRSEEYGHEVASKKPNPWGIYDMHGNMWEWCSVFEAGNQMSGGDTKGSPAETGHVLRGGGWPECPTFLRCANRTDGGPAVGNFGIRVVRAAEQIANSRFQPDPGRLTGFRQSIGNTIAFNVTGVANGGSVWGSNPYTADSQIARAAVHAGVLKPGESGVVRVTILPGQQSYGGSVKNGVSTFQYGSFFLSYRIEGAAAEAAPPPLAPGVVPAPYSLTQYRDSVGKTVSFNVVGSLAGGTVWGSNPYTADSQLARAAVHAGVLKPGESGVVRVTILPGQQSYGGSVKNGVSTSAWGPYGLSFRIAKD